MNSIVLVGTIIQDPQIRYTAANQTPICTALLQFEQMGEKNGSPIAHISMVGWGKKANEMKESIKTGDRVITSGSLQTYVVERPEGFKETRVELNVATINTLGSDDVNVIAPSKDLDDIPF